MHEHVGDFKEFRLANHRFDFGETRQFFVGMHHEALSVVPMRIHSRSIEQAVNAVKRRKKRRLFGFMITDLTTRSSKPLAVLLRCSDFVKPFFVLTALARASSRSAHSS